MTIIPPLNPIDQGAFLTTACNQMIVNNTTMLIVGLMFTEHFINSMKFSR